jgi:EPS-associated MarR family transcriptional regulator
VLAQLGAHPVEQPGGEQEAANVGGLPLQHLVEQEVGDVAVAAREPLDERVDVVAPDQRQCRELEARHPSLGALGEAGDLTGIDGDLREVREELRRLRIVETQVTLAQLDQLAGELGVSVGKVNFCLRALLERGLVKVRNFRDSNNKLAYAYYLTPKGARDKVRTTSGFLKRKLAEYEAMQKEIEELKREVGDGIH